jgi:hypothetical protein
LAIKAFEWFLLASDGENNLQWSALAEDNLIALVLDKTITENFNANTIALIQANAKALVYLKKHMDIQHIVHSI